MKKTIILLFVVLLFKLGHTQVNGSSYQTAIGLKFYPGALSMKHFISDQRSIEGLAYFWDYGTRFTGLYEIHKDIDGIEGLRWYFGPGAHVGFWNSKWQNVFPTRQTGMNIGLDGVLGIEYSFSDLPLSISADWQPSLNIIGYSYFEPGWGGIGIQYHIK